MPATAHAPARAMHSAFPSLQAIFDAAVKSLDEDGTVTIPKEFEATLAWNKEAKELLSWLDSASELRNGKRMTELRMIAAAYDLGMP